METKFAYGQRVKVKSGFHRGSIGVVTDFYTRPLLGGQTEVIPCYKVLLMTPEWVSSEFYSKHVDPQILAFSESNLEGGTT